MISDSANATFGRQTVGEDWMPATGTHWLIKGDPCMLWLEFHGEAYGFSKDPCEHNFLGFVGEKGRQFEAAWLKNNAPDAKRVLSTDSEVRRAAHLDKLLGLIRDRTPVIHKAPLWWAADRIYGVADLLVLTSWLTDRYPHLDILDDGPDHYVAIDLKFTSKLDTEKKRDFAAYRGQLILYSYMLGKLQGTMPKLAFVISRDTLNAPIKVVTELQLQNPLPTNLCDLRDRYVDIKLNGAQYLPWQHAIVAPLVGGSDDAPWHTAKKTIASEMMPGRALELVHEISKTKADELRALGINSLDSLIASDPATLGLLRIKGLGDAAVKQISTILEAHRTGKASRIPKERVPSASIELFVDYEYLSNVNVDFDRQWPTLDGCEMVFMIGVGFERDGEWKFKQFVAEAETVEAERAMFEEFLEFLRVFGALSEEASAALYHWSSAERWHSSNAAERHGLDALGRLPWVDLERVFLDVPIGIPGLLTFGLKPTARALGRYAPEFAVEWPDGLADGLSAQVMGWEAYRTGNAPGSVEMAVLGRYLEIDVKATWQILRWLRSVTVGGELCEELPAVGSPALESFTGTV